MFALVRAASAAAVSVLVGVLAGCAPRPEAKPPVDVAKAAEEVRAVETAWNADWKAKDADKLLAHYMPDATLAAPGFPAAHGADAIKQAYAAILADPAFSLSFSADTVEVAGSGEMAVTAGRYEQTGTDPKSKKVVKETGSYATAYKKGADGVWRAFEDIASAGPAS